MKHLKIWITIEDEDTGTQLCRATAGTIERAVEEIYALERYLDKRDKIKALDHE